MPRDTKTKIISIQIINNVIFDPHTIIGRLVHGVDLANDDF